MRNINTVNKLSVEAFKQVVPKSLKSSVTTELIDTINNITEEEQLRDYYKDNLIGFSTVLTTGKFKLEDYNNAVRYCTYKLYGDTNINAWVKTFPDRYKKLIDKGLDSKAISSHVAAYSKNILVNRIMEQSIIPSYVYNRDIHQDAINKLASIMANEKASHKSQLDSAGLLLTHLKVPETAKLEIDVGIKDDNALTEMKRALLELSSKQQKNIEHKINTANDIAGSVIIQGEVIEKE